MNFPSVLTPERDDTFIDSWPSDRLECLALENLRYEVGFYTEEAFLTQRPGWKTEDWEMLIPASIIARYGAMLHRAAHGRDDLTEKKSNARDYWLEKTGIDINEDSPERNRP